MKATTKNSKPMFPYDQERINNAKTQTKESFEDFMKRHPFPNTKSFTATDWEADMYEHWKEENETKESPVQDFENTQNDNAMPRKESVQHTQGEWKVFEEKHNHKFHIERDKTTIAILHYSERYAHLVERDEAKANAEYICKTANSHEKLVAALRQAIQYLNEDCNNAFPHFQKYATELLDSVK